MKMRIVDLWFLINKCRMLINVNKQIYIFEGKLGIIKEYKELWIINKYIQKLKIKNDKIIIK